MQRPSLEREARLLAARSPSVNIKSHAAASHETAACNGLMDREGSIRCNILSWLHAFVQSQAVTASDVWLSKALLRVASVTQTP